MHNSEINQRYLCSITSQIMVDPVFTSDGQTYEREAIEQWLENHDTSPKTGERLLDKKLTPNWDKKSDILDFLSRNQKLYDGDDIYLPKAWIQQLCDAVKFNQITTLKELLTKDKRLLTIQDDQGYTAFHLSCEFGSPELVDTLLKALEQKNELNKIIMMDKPIKFNPIHLNVLLQNLLLEQKIKVEYDLSLLQDLGANLEQTDDYTKNTLLHKMVISGNLQSVTWLLARGAEKEAVNYEGNTPLLLSVLNNHVELTEFLLKNNANHKVENFKQQSPISVAILNQNKSIMSLLLGKIASLPALHIALELNDLKLIEVLLTQTLIPINQLIEALNEKKQTPMHVSVVKGYIEATKLLLGAGAESTIIYGSQQSTLLHLAVESKNLSIVTLLLQTKVLTLINHLDFKGHSPLHIAASLEEEAIILKLLEAGADHKNKNHENQTLVELLRQKNKIRIANLIEQTARSIKKSKFEEMCQRVEKLEGTITILLEQQHKEFSIKQSNLAIEENNHRNVLQNEEKSQHLIILNNFKYERDLLLHRRMISTEQQTKFLHHVGFGEQNEAEAMLKSTPNLAMVLGDLNDCAGRHFKKITGFQYSILALDYHMWTMIKKYLTKEDTCAQLEELTRIATLNEQKGWIIISGANTDWPSISWSPLIDSLTTYVKNYNAWNAEQRNNHWCQQVGGAQLILPAHVINEYSHPSRPFYPCPNWSNEEAALPRTGVADWRGTAVHSRARLLCGNFAWQRGDNLVERQSGEWETDAYLDSGIYLKMSKTRQCQWGENSWGRRDTRSMGPAYDLSAISELLKARTEQAQMLLKSELIFSPSSSPRPKC